MRSIVFKFEGYVLEDLVCEVIITDDISTKVRETIKLMKKFGGVGDCLIDPKINILRGATLNTKDRDCKLKKIENVNVEDCTLNFTMFGRMAYFTVVSRGYLNNKYMTRRFLSKYIGIEEIIGISYEKV